MDRQPDGSFQDASSRPLAAPRLNPMALRSGPSLLVLVWALLSAGAEGSLPEEPCEQQIRYRQSAVELGGAWVSTVAVLSSVCATWLFVFYALHCLCVRQGPCGQEAEEEGDVQGEGGQGSSAETNEDSLATCAPCSQGFPSAPPRCGSRTPVYTQAQRAYVRQLACIEQELEVFLREVRTRRCAQGEIILKETCPQSESWEADKLRVTVYEVADCEVAGGRERRRSERQRIK